MNEFEPEQESLPRRIPALLTYLNPFRLIQATPSDEWTPTIEEINSGTWDRVKLHEIIGGIDVGLPPPYHMAVCFDGALALPPIPELRAADKAVEFFNRCLGALLLGGIYCEAVTLDHVEVGYILDWKYVRETGQGKSFVNQFHLTARRAMAPPIHAIELLNPRKLDLRDLSKSAEIGIQILSQISELNPGFLLKGTTSLARHDWGAALANLWVVVEELTSHLWKKRVLLPASSSNILIPGRQDQLQDNRTWTTSAKHELLHQIGLLSPEIMLDLQPARKARNNLVHQGISPDNKSATAAFNAIKGLFGLCTDVDIPLFKLDLDDHSLSDPFQPRAYNEPLEPKYWMAIPKLPGEEEIEREEVAMRSLQSIN